MSSFFNKFDHKNDSSSERHTDYSYEKHNFINKPKIPNFLQQKRTSFNNCKQNNIQQKNYNFHQFKSTINIQNKKQFLKNITNAPSQTVKFNDCIKSGLTENQPLVKKIQRIDILYDKIKSKSKHKNYNQYISPKDSFKKRESMFDSKTSLLSFNSKPKSQFIQNNKSQFDFLRASDKTHERNNNNRYQNTNLKKYTFRHSISSSNINYFQQFSNNTSLVDFSKFVYDNNINNIDPKFNFSLRASKVELKLNFQDVKLDSFNIQHLKIEPFPVKTIECQIQTQNQQTARFNFQQVQISSKEKQKNQLNIKILNSNIKHKLSVKDFIIGPCKGQGRFGKVYMAIQKTSNFIVALKVIKKQSLLHIFEQFIQQIKLQTYMNHPYIVKLYGYFSEGDFFYIIMEYMQQGSLFSNLKRKIIFSQQQSAIKLREVSLGLQQMHKFDIIHRDLKPQNIVLSFNVCKICDFGWAAYCKTRRQTNCGTLDYLCPQVIEGETYSFSVDLWGLGVLSYQMLIGKPPFYNISRKQTIKKIKDCSFILPNYLSQQSKQVIECLLKRQPQERLNITSILELNFFKKYEKIE